MQATDISANLHNKVTKSRAIAHEWIPKTVTAYATLAYAAKVLKELHESQMIAGKGAGTIASQTHLWQGTNCTQRREAVGLSCCSRPQ